MDTDNGLALLASPPEYRFADPTLAPAPMALVFEDGSLAAPLPDLACDLYGAPAPDHVVTT